MLGRHAGMLHSHVDDGQELLRPALDRSHALRRRIPVKVEGKRREAAGKMSN
jgi:hypothetical protein